MHLLSIVYQDSRRRIFYIDVGNLPKIKAEQYLKDVMNRYRNKLVYDASTGEIRDDRNHMSMLEDFWLPRREGGRGTEITTLPGGSNLGEIDDIHTFRENYTGHSMFQSQEWKQRTRILVLVVPQRLQEMNLNLLSLCKDLEKSLHHYLQIF